MSFIANLLCQLKILHNSVVFWLKKTHIRSQLCDNIYDTSLAGITEFNPEIMANRVFPKLEYSDNVRIELEDFIIVTTHVRSTTGKVMI